MMSAIRGKDTRPELMVRRYLHAVGFRYRLHARNLPGTPDLVFPRYRAVVFVHGCFWHRHPGCHYATTPATRREFWLEKLEANRQRDLAARSSLLEKGWRVITVWECGLRHQAEAVLPKLAKQLSNPGLTDPTELELPGSPPRRMDYDPASGGKGL